MLPKLTIHEDHALFNNMRLIKPYNKLPYALAWLLLSIVVNVNGCSSFNGWRANNNPRVHNDKSVKITKQHEVPCASHLDRELCQNGGRCIMRIEPICVCTKGWSGERCMQKVTEGNYNVKANRTLESSSVPTSTEVNSSTPRPELHPDLANFPTQDCPKPYDDDFCLNGGKCRLLSHGFSFMCLCDYPYTGFRCGEKSFDGNYLGLIRHARDLSSTTKSNKKVRRKPHRSRIKQASTPDDDANSDASTHHELSSNKSLID